AATVTSTSRRDRPETSCPRWASPSTAAWPSWPLAPSTRIRNAVTGLALARDDARLAPHGVVADDVGAAERTRSGSEGKVHGLAGIRGEIDLVVLPAPLVRILVRIDDHAEE